MGHDELTGIHSGLQQLGMSISALNIIMSRAKCKSVYVCCQIILICIIIMYIYFFLGIICCKNINRLLSNLYVIKLIMYAFLKIYTTVHLSPNKCVQEVT